MKQLFQKPIALFCICLLVSCKQEYYQKVKSNEQSVLVAEGMLNSAGGPTTIRLSRTLNLRDSVRIQPETGAQVLIESKSGNTIPLNDFASNGIYSTSQTTLDPAEQYRVHIVTSNGNEYASDLIAVLKNPPIDSINWRRDTNGVTIFVNTHNPENDTRYYRWEYEETWEFRTAFISRYKLSNTVPRNPIERNFPEEEVYDCWHFYNSSNLILGTTTQLASDVVFEKPLIKIPQGDDKLSVRYSVLVRQFALDKAGYEFYQTMRKNTESLGSIFDAQPSEIGGNIHALTNSAEPVIGYITAAPVQEKRIFISRNELPVWDFEHHCLKVEINNTREDIDTYLSSGVYQVIEPHGEGPSIVGWYVGLPECVDCTKRGGVTQKPSYW